jgi:hypothetical protein
VTALVTNTSIRAQWFQKWQVHRRLRPEEYGGRVHVELNPRTNPLRYPIPSELLSSPVLPLVLQRNAERGLGTAGTYLHMATHVTSGREVR